MSSASPFSFTNPAELLLQAGSIPQYLYTGAPTVTGRGGSESAGEFSSPSTVTSVKTENWSNNSSDRQLAFDSQRLPQVGYQEGSHSNIDRLALLASVASDSVIGLGSSSSHSLSTYMAEHNVQALQTLHLMHPNFTGYGDIPNQDSNMVLFGSGPGAVASHGGSLGSSDQQHHHHHYVGYSLPSAMISSSSSLSHDSHIASMAITELGHQDNPPSYYTKRSGSQGYNWGGGSEFSFLSSGQGTPTNQPLASQMNIVKSAQVASSIGMPPLGVGNTGQTSYHDQALLFTNSGMAVHGVNADNMQAPSGAGHILSLSLSSQQPSMMQQLHGFPMQQHEASTNFLHGLSGMGTDNTIRKEDLIFNRGVGANNVGESFTIPACENMLDTRYQGPSNPGSRDAIDMLASQFAVGSYGSKYLRPALELLNEVVSIGRGIKGNVLKRSKQQQQCNMATTAPGDVSFGKSLNATDVSCKAMVSWSGEREAEPVVSAVPGNVEHAMENVEISAVERQELHAKRAKLVGMRDEVDRRYKQYYHQMQMVVTFFESASGLGAATAYTALALKTISKHFRCLRDSITEQIQATCKRLGEEAAGFARGETSRLRFIDQQLRQQRALRHLGMMQQQAWRPQRGLPEHSVSILRAWLFEHFLHPYPKDADKIMLAKQTGLNRNQVSNWFINARVRLWKPMVEEMYIAETREAEVERGDKSGVSEGDVGDEEAERNDGAPSNDIAKPSKQAKLSDASHGAYHLDRKGPSSYDPDMLTNKALAGSPSDHALLHGKESMMQGVMKPRNLPQNMSLLSPHLNTEVDKTIIEAASEGQNMTRTEAYVTQGTFGQADHLNLAAYGSYQIANGLRRYGHESFGASSNGATGGVSLTLGLQHCDGLSFSGSQQHYGQGSSTHLFAGRQEEDGVSAADYYNVNESTFEGLGIQNRKPFPAHMLCHDFVV